MSKTHSSSYVEIKTVTWAKDSHGLFDYESKNINFTRHKVESYTKVFKEGNDILLKGTKDKEAAFNNSNLKDTKQIFSVNMEKENEKYYLHVGEQSVHDEEKSRSAFLIVRSIKNDDGTAKGYDLELGDIIRLGRIEYRFIEYQNENQQIFSLLQNNNQLKTCPFTLVLKDCNSDGIEAKKTCRICLLDEDDTDEQLINPCNCKGTSEHVHIKCLQDWVSSKVKRKTGSNTECAYWKKLNCEVCKIPLPDLVDIKGEKKELIPIARPSNPYILLERVFYDKTKTKGENSKTMIILALSDKSHQIKLGRGHECDLRENDISVSRLHAFIKYRNGRFSIFDNNSKFGTLILLRKNYDISKRKVALQIGRTVITFSLKSGHQTPVIPTAKSPQLVDKLKQWCAPKVGQFVEIINTMATTNGDNKENDLNLSFLD